jgi:hypothetical protein
MSERTWTDNVRVINQLWPGFNPTEEYRLLFRDTFADLNQDALYTAIRNARAENEGPWPVIKFIMHEYREVCRLSRASFTMQTVKAVQRTKFDFPDPEEQQKLVSQMREYIGVSKDEQFREIEKRVLDKLDGGKLCAASAYGVLMDLRRKVFGDAPGLCTVTRSGELRPMPPLVRGDSYGFKEE